MPSQTLTNAEFEAFITENELVFIDFWAEWCAPCKQFSRVYDQVADQFTDIKFVKINIEEEKQLADFFEIRSIPHLIIFKEGIVIYSDAGNLPESSLKELVRQALDADISEIKNELQDNG